jgi:hypothetical protein
MQTHSRLSDPPSKIAAIQVYYEILGQSRGTTIYLYPALFFNGRAFREYTEDELQNVRRGGGCIAAVVYISYVSSAQRTTDVTYTPFF